MKITPHELENIFSFIDLGALLGSKPVFISLDANTQKTSENNWRKVLESFLGNIKDTNQIYVINFSINYEYCGLNNILLVIRPKEFTPDFIKVINDYINLSDTSILEFLGQQWKLSKSSYPLTFFWRKSWYEESTLISYRAVAPAYQNKGLMTQVSLGLIKKIAESSNAKGEHRLQAITTNIHTYAFFYPKNVKDKPSYNQENKIDISCAEVLARHDIKLEKEIHVESSNNLEIKPNKP